jgi:hypothetical protein
LREEAWQGLEERLGVGRRREASGMDEKGEAWRRDERRCLGYG